MKRIWMQFLKLGSFIFVTCVTLSCASNSKSSGGPEEEQVITFGKNAGLNKPVAPNSAEIIAVIVDLSKDGGDALCNLNVRRILSIGSAAGGLAVGTKISVAVPSRFLDENQITQLSESQEPVKVKLSYLPNKKLGGTETAWEISEIIE